jgi:TPR repeat protein
MNVQVAMKRRSSNTLFIIGFVIFAALVAFMSVNAYTLPPWASRIRAELGDRDAQSHLGFMYSKGVYIEKDSAEAVKWWKRAAAQGNVQTAFNIGVTYEHGNGVPRNDVEAEKWYRISAKGGYPEAQNNLGGFYLNGRGGLRQNVAKAREWYQKAADQGYELAIDNLKRVQETLIPLSEGSNGIDRALEDAGKKKFNFIDYDWISSKPPREPKTVTKDGFSKAFDVLCDSDLRFASSTMGREMAGLAPLKQRAGDFQMIGETCLSPIEGLALNDVPAPIRLQQSNYNTTLVLHPDFPLPHLCRIDPATETKEIKNEILSKMHISEQEYAMRRLAVEKSSIFTAAYFGHLDAVKNHIAQANDYDEVLRSPIEYAIRGRHFEIFKYLLEHGVSPDVIVGGSPMFPPQISLIREVIRPSMEEFLNFLMKFHPKIDYSVLFSAAALGNFALAEKWIKADVPVSRNELFELASRIPYRAPGALAFLKILLSKGLTVKEIEKETPCETSKGPMGHCGFPLVCTMIRAGNIEGLKFTLAAGGDPNGVSIQRPLQCAAEAGNVEAITILLDAGADPHLKNRKGGTFLAYAKDETDKKKLSDILSQRNIHVSTKMPAELIDPFVVNVADAQDPSMYDQKTFHRLLTPQQKSDIVQAANEGNDIAQSILARMYSEGWGIEQSNVQAFLWYSLAAKSSDQDMWGAKIGTSGLKFVTDKMTPEQISEGERLLKSWKPTPAQE